MGVRGPEWTSQDPASRPISDRSGSWAFEAPEGAYGPIPAWTSGAAWFDALMDALATHAGEERRREAHVAAGTLLRVARADWLAADVATGRGVATANETVAADLGMSAKTVQRAHEGSWKPSASPSRSWKDATSPQPSVRPRQRPTADARCAPHRSVRSRCRSRQLWRMSIYPVGVKLFGSLSLTRTHQRARARGSRPLRGLQLRRREIPSRQAGPPRVRPGRSRCSVSLLRWSTATSATALRVVGCRGCSTPAGRVEPCTSVRCATCSPPPASTPRDGGRARSSRRSTGGTRRRVDAPSRVSLTTLCGTSPGSCEWLSIRRGRRLLRRLRSAVLSVPLSVPSEPANGRPNGSGCRRSTVAEFDRISAQMRAEMDAARGLAGSASEASYEPASLPRR